MTKAERTRRKRLWPWMLLSLFAIATVCKAILNATFDNFKGLEEHHSWSSAAAREKGTLVCELEPDGPLPSVHGEPLDFHGAWVENRHLECHPLVWFPGVRRLEGHNVCVLVGLRLDREFVVVEPLRYSDSWASQGQTLFLFRIERWDDLPISIGVTEGFRQPVTGELRLKARR